mmetsp:Transcript_1425/g.3078  ORF Transcript_1425/g.3078 Transcript_1425/m.3078 type:complete len:211 (+) Transcript_1425:2268-2900(+)
MRRGPLGQFRGISYAEPVEDRADGPLEVRKFSVCGGGPFELHLEQPRWHVCGRQSEGAADRREDRAAGLIVQQRVVYREQRVEAVPVLGYQDGAGRAVITTGPLPAASELARERQEKVGKFGTAAVVIFEIGQEDREGVYPAVDEPRLSPDRRRRTVVRGILFRPFPGRGGQLGTVGGVRQHKTFVVPLLRATLLHPAYAPPQDGYACHV